MRKQYSAFLVFVVMLLGVPVAAQAEDFCSSLKRVREDAPNYFLNVANMQLAGFSNCRTLGKAGGAVYTCEKPTQENIIADVKNCFPDWARKLDIDGVLILGRTEDLSLTVTAPR